MEKFQTNKDNITIDTSTFIRKLIRNETKTVHSKCAMLEYRDRYYCSIAAKNNSAELGTIIGSCDDMCPEKEHLQRMASKKISPFEIFQFESVGIVNKEFYLLKEFKNTELNEAEILPSMLRTEKALSLTMYFLLTRVINLADCEGSLTLAVDEWYTFICNRMQSIYQDIVIQKMYTPITVDIIEQCLRFRIICSARFYNEVGDNTDIIIKCFDLLIAMYAHLDKEKIICRNKTEFYVYFFLLHLKNESKLSHVYNSLPDEDKYSDNMNTIWAVCKAIDTNNYISLFQLAVELEYLQLCILVKYFPEIRVRAMPVLMSELNCSMQNIMQEHIAYVTVVLGFLNEEETMNFLKQYDCLYSAKPENILKFGTNNVAIKNENYIPRKFYNEFIEIIAPLNDVSHNLSLLKMLNNYTANSSFDKNDNYCGTEIKFEFPINDPTITPMTILDLLCNTPIVYEVECVQREPRPFVIYTVSACVNGVKYFGKNKNKERAKLEAANDALKYILKPDKLQSISFHFLKEENIQINSTPPASKNKDKNIRVQPVWSKNCQTATYFLKLKYPNAASETIGSKNEKNELLFTTIFTVNDSKFYGVSSNKKGSMQAAAKTALMALCKPIFDEKGYIVKLED